MENNNYLSSIRISLFQIYVKYYYLDLTTVQLHSDCESYEYSFSVKDSFSFERVTTRLIEEISAKYF